MKFIYLFLLLNNRSDVKLQAVNYLAYCGDVPYFPCVCVCVCVFSGKSVQTHLQV
jgi:hypothetical protein